MLVLQILRWDKSRAWTDWGGRAKKGYAEALGSACPSMRLTERKRLAKKLADGASMSIIIEDLKYAESLSHVLEATGAVISMDKAEPNQSLQRNAGSRPSSGDSPASETSFSLGPPG
jgi:hypothetical protein